MRWRIRELVRWAKAEANSISSTTVPPTCMILNCPDGRLEGEDLVHMRGDEARC